MTTSPRTSALQHADACRKARDKGRPSPVYDGPPLLGADLRGADLRGADLRGADLYGADLSGADLSEAILIDVTWCRATIDGAIVGDGIGGPGSILCALTEEEWATVQEMRSKGGE